MQTKTITFRIPIGLKLSAQERRVAYGFDSVGALLSLALTCQVAAALQGKFKTKDWMEGCKVPMACRVSHGVYKSITLICATKYKDTKAAWAGIAIYYWIKAQYKAEAKLLKGNPHLDWRREYGRQLLAEKPALIAEIDKLYSQIVQ